MSINELQSAIDGLPRTEQEELLRHLEANLRRANGSNGAESREDWMKRLDSLRVSIAGPKSPSAGEQILSELRDE